MVHIIWTVQPSRSVHSISVTAISSHLDSVTKWIFTVNYGKFINPHHYSSPIPVSTKQVKMEQFTNSKHLTEIQK